MFLGKFVSRKETFPKSSVKLFDENFSGGQPFESKELQQYMSTKMF